MPAQTTCPQANELESLARGQLPPDQAEALASHLETCDSCLARAAALPTGDTLLSDLRSAETSSDSPSEEQVVERLIERLAQLAPRGRETQSGSAATELTLGTASSFSFLAPAQAAGELGRLGSYRVLQSLGSGGMGVVFLAEDEQLRRRVALKAMHTPFTGDPAARERFLREARTLAAIEHEHIVTIYQVGEDRGIPFLAMQLLVGESLDDRLKREGKLSLAEAVRIAREMAAGLAAAHARGLIHRDIKPGNLWLEGERGRVKILDFGLARGLGSDVELTQSGAIVGTPAYMPPEQASGQAVDDRADLFSLGVVLYRMLTGESPFQRANITATLVAIATHQPPSPHELNPSIPAPLSNLVTRLLSKSPDSRPASASHLLQELSSLVLPTPENLPATSSPSPSPSPSSYSYSSSYSSSSSTSPSSSPRRPWLVAIALGGLAALLLCGVWIIIKDKDGKQLAKIKSEGPVTVEVQEEPSPPPRNSPGKTGRGRDHDGNEARDKSHAE